MRYVLLNGIVIIVLLGLFAISQYVTTQTTVRIKDCWRTAIIVIGLTACFDPLIIAAGIVAYNPESTLGITFFGAPIEDFAYAIAAALVIPLLWDWYARKH